MTSWSIRSPDASAVWVERDTYILMFGAKWLGERKTKIYALPDYPGYAKDKHSDKKLCGDLHRLLSEATHVCAHNGDAFDIKKINSRLIVNGYSPPSPYKTIDTLKLSRRTFKFDSNKLDNLGRYLGEGRKIPNTGAALWRGVVAGDPASVEAMSRYCRQDVELLQRVYLRLRAWHPTHPDLTLHSDGTGCPVCQSHHIQSRGINIAKIPRQRLQCSDCAHWFSAPIPRQKKAA